MREIAAAQGRLDILVREYLAAGCPAVVIAAWHRGELVIHQAWGWIDPDQQQFPVTTAALFDLASLTKLFTTTAFLSLAADGRIELDSPLVHVIPEFGGAPRSVDGGVDPHTKRPLPVVESAQGLLIDPQEVTFRHLLTHTAGLAAWRPVMDAAGPAPLPPEQTDPVPRAERWGHALHSICNAPFVTPVGQQVRYSDLGLMLLGESVARLAGCPLDQAIRQRVLDPLGLRAQSVCFNPIGDHRLSPYTIAPTEMDDSWRCRRVWGEVHDENACGVGGTAGHAGMFGTAEAVLQLGTVWLTQPSVLGVPPELARQATAQQVQTGQERRGLGWMLRSTTGSSAGELFSPDSYGHTGFTGTSLWIDPRAQLVVACLTNSVYVGRHIYAPLPFRRAVHTLLAEHV